MKLPEIFTDRMKMILGEDYERFIESFEMPYYTSLKVNTLKIDVESFVKIFPYELTPVPWTQDGFYYHSEDPVTKHPYFHAGLFYVQEPSAMSPVNALRPEKGDLCLDLCAAPGGKSMQIATAIQEQGLLVTNDINETRVKAILRNAEKFGLRNVVILNETPENIAKVMGNRFNRILVDAPCSGEGMFRKDPKAVKSWETFGPEVCHEIQRSIMNTLESLISKESQIVYSTCTFSPHENEEQLDYLLSKENMFKPRTVALNGIDSVENAPYMAHIWPHIHQGEGHFIGSMTGYSEQEIETIKYEPNDPPEFFKAFMENHLKEALSGHFVLEGEKLYLRPELQIPTKGLRVVREGLLLGEVKKGRFTPSQALAMHLKSENFEPCLDLSSQGMVVMKYLKGETIFCESPHEGLHLVCTDGYPLGFAKIASGTVKNLYPISWRMMA